MKALKIIGKIFAVIYSIIFFIILDTLISLYLFRGLLNKDTHQQIIKNIDFSNVKLSDFNIKIEDTTTTIEDYMIIQMSKIDIEEKEAKKILDDVELRDELSQYISKLLDYYIFNNEQPTLDKEKLLEIANKLEVTDKMNEHNIDPEHIIDIANNYLDENLPKNNNIAEINYGIEALNTFANSKTLIIITITFVIVSIAIFSLLTWSLIRPLTHIGIPFILIGLLNILNFFTIPTILEMITNAEFITSILPSILKPMLYFSITILIVGIILIIIRVNLDDKINTEDEPVF